MYLLADGLLSAHSSCLYSSYKEHAIFGIDLSSAIAVEALEIQKDDQVLDLCCAPGAKLCMIANLLGRDGLGTVTGVDLAGHRLATCRSLLKKYKVGEKVRLFEADGTTFSVPPPSRLGSRMIHSEADKDMTTNRKRQKMDVVKPFWASRLLRFDHQTPSSSTNALYDKVLVDAECTHDGSIAHILKYEKWGWDTFEKNFMDPHRIDTIAELQVHAFCMELVLGELLTTLLLLCVIVQFNETRLAHAKTRRDHDLQHLLALHSTKRRQRRMVSQRIQRRTTRKDTQLQHSTRRDQAAASLSRMARCH